MLFAVQADMPLIRSLAILYQITVIHHGKKDGGMLIFGKR